MPRAPYLIALALFVSCVGAAVHLSGGPGPFSDGSGMVLGIGVLMYAVIAVAGLLLSRGRWTRRLAIALVVAVIAATALTAPWSVAAIVAVAGAGIALVGLSGRWLDGWIRRLPSAQGPGPMVMALVLGLVGLVPAVALAAPTDISAWHGVLGGAGVFLAWGYSRAEVWALWTVRFALPLIAVPALLRTPVAGATLLAAVVVGLTTLSWTREALLAVQPLMDDLPGPRVLGERREA